MERKTPKFIRRLYDMTCQEEKFREGKALGFDEAGEVLELRDGDALAELLPTYFKSNKVSSLVRQLHYYGFRAVVPSVASNASQSFLHGSFRRDHPEGFGGIKRPRKESCSESEETEPVQQQPRDVDTLALLRQLRHTQAVNARLMKQNLALVKRVREVEESSNKATTSSQSKPPQIQLIQALCALESPANPQQQVVAAGDEFLTLFKY